MRNRKLVTLALSTTALAGAVLAAPAASAADTTVTFTISSGNLSVATAASSAQLAAAGSLVGGTAVGGALPTVTITDNRAGVVGWSGNVASAGFYATADTAKSIKIGPDKARVYVPGVVQTVSGVAVASAGTHLTAATGRTLSTTAAPLVTTTSLTGSNQVTYTPSVEVTIDSTVLAGDYAGVITHTVS